MGLASSLSTALTGLNAAETQIDVLGNNLANSQTVGFKSSEVIFANQFLQTLSLGASPTADNGGTDPRQTGLGVQVAGISPNFTQGTIQISSSASDLAIQGEGFLIVEAAGKEKLYTRNGILKLNSENQLVTPTGNRVLGFGIDDRFNILATDLVPLEVPLGSEAVAQATANVVMEGVLTPNGDLADTAEVIQSAILSDAGVPRPDGSGISIANAPNANVAGVTPAFTDGGGGLVENSVYRYRFAFLDASGKESLPSSPVSVTIPTVNGLPDNQVTLNGLPDAPGAYSQLRIYRTDADGSDFFLLDTIPTGVPYTDTGLNPLGAPLDDSTLDGNYSYLVTFHSAGSPESRPSVLLGPQNTVNGRIRLSDFPTPPTGDNIPPYDQIRIYRNTATDQNSFYLVDTVDPGADYTDSRSDAEISDLSIPGNKLVDLDGPTIDSNTTLVNILRREEFDYVSPFKVGTLSFEGKKGNRSLAAKSFEITAGSTVQDLADFIEDALGIQTQNTNSSNPIPASLNTIPGESGTLLPGAYVQDGTMRFVSNNGVDNAVDIDLTSFRITGADGEVDVSNLGFDAIQEARGQSAVSDFIAYDTLGIPVRTRVTAVLEKRSDTATTYRWFADSSDNSPSSGSGVAVGTGLLTFDGFGNFISATDSTVSIERDGIPSSTPLEINLDFSGMSGLATESASLAASRQDGSPPGTLTDFVIGEDGRISGVFSNGVTRDLGQVRLARFSNPSGLEQRGQNLFSQGPNAGLPIEGGPGENGIGSLVAGALELSNTDIGGDLVDLVLASTQYRSNARVITATQQLFDELLNLRR